MAALDTAALIIEHGNLWVGDDVNTLVDCGAVRNVKFMAKQVHTRVESDNRGTVIDKVRLNGEITADLLEVGNAAILENIFKGIITRSTSAGSPVTGATTVKASGAWSYNVPFKLGNMNGDGTKQTITSVVAGTNGSLVANVDYVQVQFTDGDWGVQIIDSTTVTTTAQTITVTYNYTPAASQALSGGTNQTATSRYVRIIGPSEDNANVTRVVELQDATAESDMLIPFVEVEQANDVGVMPVQFVNRKGATWTYTDQINPS